MSDQKEVQSKMMMAIVCCFLGFFGVHRLMMGHKNWWLMPLTGGGCYIWILVDLYNILTGGLKMEDGRDLS